MSFSDTDTSSTSERDDGDGLHFQVALVLVLECQRPTARGLRVPLDAGARLRIGRGDARELSSRDAAFELRVPDRKMSAQHAEFERRGDQLVLLDVGSTNGTYVNRRRWSESGALQDGDVVQIGHTFFIVQARAMPPSARGLDAALEAQGFATLEPGLAARFSRLARIAQTPLPVLLLGGTGTGKELLARAVHQRSGRRGPFVAVNCGALAPSLIESQLFGHVRGAFSGADRDQPGLVRTAHTGTLFLDEIGELRGDAQATLLRVLQEGEVLAVGATQPVRVDLRVVSATLKPLDAQDADDNFRRDLYARLAGFVFTLPPLAQRREDLGNIIATLLERSAMRQPRAISVRPAVADLFLRYGWPLNIRELEQVLAAASALADDGIVRPEHLPDALRQLTSSTDSPPPKPSPSDFPEPERALRAEVIRQLREHAGNVTATARAMGKARQQLQRWMRRFEIDPTRLEDLD